VEPPIHRFSTQTPKGGEIAYSEGLLVGYHGFDRSEREPLFCFGHGLGYTEWSYDLLVLESDALQADESLPVVVTVRNAGQRAGRDVVQVYLEAPDDDPSRPLRVLAAFASAEADAGQSAEGTDGDPRSRVRALRYRSGRLGPAAGLVHGASGTVVPRLSPGSVHSTRSRLVPSLSSPVVLTGAVHAE